MVKCQFAHCQWSGMLTDYCNHYAEHVRAPEARACDHCAMEFGRKQELLEHLDEMRGTCLEQPVTCPFGGCVYSGAKGTATPAESEPLLRRKDLASHLDAGAAYHLELFYASVNTRLEQLERKPEM